MQSRRPWGLRGRDLHVTIRMFVFGGAFSVAGYYLLTSDWSLEPPGWSLGIIGLCVGIVILICAIVRLIFAHNQQCMRCDQTSIVWVRRVMLCPDCGMMEAPDTSP